MKCAKDGCRNDAVVADIYCVGHEEQARLRRMGNPKGPDMRKLLIGGAIVAVLVLLFAVVCRAGECATSWSMFMRGEALWESNGDVWLQLTRRTSDEYACPWGGTVELAACTAPTSPPSASAWLGFNDDDIVATLGQNFDFIEWSRECSPTDHRYNVVPTDALVTLLRNWANGSAPTLTVYVGRFSDGSRATSPCATCDANYDLGNDLSTTEIVYSPDEEGQPFWQLPWRTIASNPVGCAPECSLPTDAVFDTPPTWGAAKSLFR